MVDPLERLAFDPAELATLCRQHLVAELQVFGSVLREDFRPDSDVDVLVTWIAGSQISLFELSRLQRALEVLFCRRVDVVPKNGLKPLIRDEVLASARTLYAA